MIGTLLFAAVLAQEAAGAAAFVSTLAVLAAGLLNVGLVGGFVKAEAAGQVKMMMSLVIAVIAGLIHALTIDWGMPTASLEFADQLVMSIMAVFGVAQGAYYVADKAIEARTGGGLNELPQLRPESGIG